MNIHPILFTTILGAGLALGTAPPARSADPANRAAVHDSNDQLVRGTLGHCVRINWVTASDECRPVRMAQAAPPPKPMQFTEYEPIPDQDRTVYFAFNKSTLQDSERRKLDSLATTLKQRNEISGVRIVGFADRIGTATDNDRLSERRARTVETYLRERGYLKTALARTRWLGESSPTTECSGALGRNALIACLQSDRRVTVEINYQSIEPRGALRR